MVTPRRAGARKLRPGRDAGVDGHEPDRRLRPLRLLPADVPHLRALARGDGLAARPDLADEGDARRHARAEPDGRRAFRPLPRLHGLPDLVPLGRAVRPADRAGARARREGGAAPGRRSAPSLARLRRLPEAEAAEACPQVQLAAGARPVQAAQGARSGLARGGQSAGGDARCRDADRARRPAHGLRPVGPLRRGQPRVGPCARRLRLRGHRSLRRLLRRARAPCRPSRAGARARTPDGRRVRRGRRGADRHERRRVRLPSEGRAPRPAGRRHLRGARRGGTLPS